jgi:hypothetical protein
MFTKWRDAPIDHDVVLLSDSMRSSHGLQIVLRVPAQAMEEGGQFSIAPERASGGSTHQSLSKMMTEVDERKESQCLAPDAQAESAERTSVGRCEVDSETSGSSGKKEGKVWRPGSVEVLDGLLSDVRGNGTCRYGRRQEGNPNEKGEEIGLTIEPLVDVTSEGHVVGHDVEHPHHLREDEHPVAVLLEPTQELVEQNHLARVHDDSLEDLVVGRRARLGPVKEEGVVAGTRRNGKGQQTRHRCGIAI